MSISEKIKIINNKIEQNKAQYNLDRQTAKISALSSENVSKYEFLTGKDVLREKELLEKAVAIKRFEYSLLGSELKKQASFTEQKYQGLNKLFKYDKKEKEPVSIKKETPAIISASKLMYGSKYSFGDYKNVRKYSDLSFTTKYHKLLSFYHRFNEFRKFNSLNRKNEN